MAKAIKKKTIPLPLDKESLGQYLVEIRTNMAEIDSIEADANVKIAELTSQIDELKKKASSKAKPFRNMIEQLAAGVYIFAVGHRTELTEEDKKKTVEFVTGDKIRWYFPKPSVVADDEEKAIAELERRGLGDFIRKKKTIDREEILKSPEKIKKLKHLYIDQTEIFAIVPAEMGVELQKGKKKFKKVLIPDI